MIARYIIGILAAAAVGLAVWGYLEHGWRRDAEDRAASLARSVAALEAARSQAKLAADVARAEAERQAAKAAEFDALREALLKGGDDAPLPDWFIAWGCSAGLWLCEGN